MKKTSYFLIPSSYSGNGDLPIDYRLIEHEIDRRTRFWKFNKNRTISPNVVVHEAERFGMRIFKDDSGAPVRFLAPNGKIAKKFCDKIKSMGWAD